MNFKALIAAGALLASQSFAIIGIGGHYAPGFGTKMKGMDKPADIAKIDDTPVSACSTAALTAPCRVSVSSCG